MTTPEALTRTLGERLTKLRRVHGIHQNQAADLIGVSRRSVARYESDAYMPPSTVLRAYAYTFDVPLEWIIDGP
jgi:transcriptional regulator with XRE-family HTH domain